MNENEVQKWWHNCVQFYPKDKPGQDVVGAYIRKGIEINSPVIIQAPPGMGKTYTTLAATIPSLKSDISKILWLSGFHAVYKTVFKEVNAYNNNTNTSIKDRLIFAEFIGKQNMCVFPEVKKKKKENFYEECSRAKISKKNCFYYWNSTDWDNSSSVFKNTERMKFFLEKIRRLCKTTIPVFENRKFSDFFIPEAESQELCPYEAMIKYSQNADIIGCDYYYYFSHINLYFKNRISCNESDAILVIDEADTFMTRLREFTTAKLTDNMISIVKEYIKKCIQDQNSKYQSEEKIDSNEIHGKDSSSKVNVKDFFYGANTRRKTKSDSEENYYYGNYTISTAYREKDYQYYLKKVTEFEKAIYEIYNEKFTVGLTVKMVEIDKRQFIQSIQDKSKDIEKSFDSWIQFFHSMAKDIFDDDLRLPRIDLFLQKWKNMDEKRFFRIIEKNPKKKLLFRFTILPYELKDAPLYYQGDKAITVVDILNKYYRTVYLAATMNPDLLLLNLGYKKEDALVYRHINYFIPKTHFRIILDIEKDLSSETNKWKDNNCARRYSQRINMIHNAIDQGHTLAVFSKKEFMREIMDLLKGKVPCIEGKSIGKINNMGKRSVICTVLGGKITRGTDFSNCSSLIICGIQARSKDLVYRKKMDYFESKGEKDLGEYLWRGNIMAESLQAAGRILRREKDIGVIILSDYRYNYDLYSRYYPEYMKNNLKICSTVKQLKNELMAFWRGIDFSELNESLEILE